MVDEVGVGVDLSVVLVVVDRVGGWVGRSVSKREGSVGGGGCDRGGVFPRSIYLSIEPSVQIYICFK